MAGQFELKEDDETGRKYWFGAEDGWMDGAEIGDDKGTLLLTTDAFPVGTILSFKTPDDLG